MRWVWVAVCTWLVGCASPEAAPEVRNETRTGAGGSGPTEARPVAADAVRASTGASSAPGEPETAPPEAPWSPRWGATPAAAEPAPSLDSLGAWLEGVAFDAAFTSYENKEFRASAAMFEAWAAAHAEDPRAPAARVWSAIALSASEAARDAEAGATRWMELRQEFPELADDFALLAAERFLAAQDVAGAKAALAGVTEEASLGRRLQLEGHIMPEDQAFRSRLRAAMAEEPGALTAETWTLGVADAADPWAARLLLARRFPNDSQGQEALSELMGAKDDALSAEARLGLAEALLEAWRLDSVVSVLSPLVHGRRPEAAACAAWVLTGRAIERKKKRDAHALERALTFYRKTLKCSGDTRAQATYLAGRALLALFPAKAAVPADATVKKGKRKEARSRRQTQSRAAKARAEGLALLTAHATEFPEQSTAEDALLLVAEAPESEKDSEVRYREIVRRFPDGDMTDQAAWALVGPLITEGAWERALAVLDEVLAWAPRADGRHAGRLRYWRGRALLELKRVAEAIPEWERVWREAPLSWYALLARAQLGRVAPDVAQALVPEAPPGGLEPVPETLWHDAHFRRALTWARLLGARSQTESRWLAWVEEALEAVPATAHQASVGWPWMRLAVLELGGGYPAAMRVARSLESALAYPDNRELAGMWRIAYPQPFKTLVERWARERGLEPAWIWAVARVESNFDPTAVSWANAYGLMQIIMPTAKSLARGTEHAATRANLLKPAVALELGTKYLAKLLVRHPAIPLASAGYNAGGGAVSKWRRQFGAVPLDTFVERIPYREANLYAKSVAQTYARYLWLYEGRLPDLDLTSLDADPIAGEDEGDERPEPPPDGTPEGAPPRE